MLPNPTELQRLIKNSKIPAWVWSLAGVILLALIVAVSSITNLTAAPDAPGGATASTTALAINITLKLGIVILLIYASLFLLRRLQSGSVIARDKKVNILETAHLSPRQKLHLVRVGEQVLLIGATDQNLTLISEVELKSAAEGPAVQEPSAETTRDGTNFTSILKQATHRQ